MLERPGQSNIKISAGIPGVAKGYRIGKIGPLTFHVVKIDYHRKLERSLWISPFKILQVLLL